MIKLLKNQILSLMMAFLAFASLAQETFEPFSTPGTQTWVVPNGVTSVTFGVWGAGGGGGGTLSQVSPLSNPRAGGGGGGAFSQVTVAVTPGETFTFNIGAGGIGGAGAADGLIGGTSAVESLGAVIAAADGGQGGAFRTSAGAVGTATGLGGSTGIGFAFAGGNGGASGTADNGAGGGGSAGSTENGYNGTSTSAGAGGELAGGNGGAPTNANDMNGNNGANPGGGGGGSIRALLAGSGTGGNGGDGMIMVNYCKVPDMPVANHILSALCEGVVDNFTVVADANATSYEWILPTGWNGASATNEIGIMAGAASGDIIVIASNVCGSSESLVVPVTTTALPAQPSVITGSATICENDIVTYAVTHDPLIDTYHWVLPTDWVGLSDTNSILAHSNTHGGTISVQSENACGISPVRVLNITVGTAPVTPSAIAGQSVLCEGTAATYSVANNPNVTSYVWTLPADWAGTSTSNSIAATSGATSGEITVVANNACGTSDAQTLVITVNPISNAVTVDGLTITATQDGAIYQWLDCTTGAPIGSATQQSFTADANGEYSVLIISAENCTVVSDCITIATVSVDSESMDVLAIYPNPANEFVTVANAAAGSTIRLMDMTGKVLTTKVASAVTNIDLSDVKAGVYFISVEGKKGSKTQKIVVRK